MTDWLIEAVTSILPIEQLHFLSGRNGTVLSEDGLKAAMKEEFFLKRNIATGEKQKENKNIIPLLPHHFLGHKNSSHFQTMELRLGLKLHRHDRQDSIHDLLQRKGSNNRHYSQDSLHPLQMRFGKYVHFQDLFSKIFMNQGDLTTVANISSKYEN